MILPEFVLALFDFALTELCLFLVSHSLLWMSFRSGPGESLNDLSQFCVRSLRFVFSMLPGVTLTGFCNTV